MHSLPYTPFAQPFYGSPIGLRGPGVPKGVVPPPAGQLFERELNVMRHVAANRDPMSDQWATYMNERGDKEMWFDVAKQYRQVAGFTRGWLGTGLMAVAMGVTSMQSNAVKKFYNRPRPYQYDPAIAPYGNLPKDGAYPSGHTSSAAAAATVMGALWPQRANEFQELARQVGYARVYSGMHYPSDVIVGARLGRRTAMNVMEPLLRGRFR